MRKPVILITGANGEIGHSLVEYFGQVGSHDIVTLDLNPMDRRLRSYCHSAITGDILDQKLIDRLVSEFEIDVIFHLAALLSTRAEYTPMAAHRVNVDGTLNLLQMAAEQARWRGSAVKFLFPSSVAVYGMPDLASKENSLPVREDDYNKPTTMYGCNKLYCEQLGRYYSLHYRQLSADRVVGGVDFRALRFPGLISAATMPSGGTSDYAPEMVHRAVRGEAYSCFVSAETRLPFLAMPDAVQGLVQLAKAPRQKLSQQVYNISAFSPSAEELRQLILKHLPTAKIDYEIDRPRALIVDTWPQEVDDSAARRDWGWSPTYDLEGAFRDYLLPGIRAQKA
jgi:nucleoside-diphosphate-sugar epimerase